MVCMKSIVGWLKLKKIAYFFYKTKDLKERKSNSINYKQINKFYI